MAGGELDEEVVCMIAAMMREMIRSGLVLASAVRISFKVFNVKPLLANRRFGAALVAEFRLAG
jgi:hypothetical protein